MVLLAQRLYERSTMLSSGIPSNSITPMTDDRSCAHRDSPNLIVGCAECARWGEKIRLNADKTLDKTVKQS